MGKTLAKDSPRLLSYADLMSRWSLPSERTIRRWIAKSSVVRPLRVGKYVRFKLFDVRRFEQMHGIPSDGG